MRERERERQIRIVVENSIRNFTVAKVALNYFYMYFGNGISNVSKGHNAR